MISLDELNKFINEGISFEPEQSEEIKNIILIELLELKSKLEEIENRNYHLDKWLEFGYTDKEYADLIKKSI